METNLSTTRLQLAALSLAETDFIIELLNTKEWKRFIGDRNIQNSNDAKTYIQKILDSESAQYWTVKLKDSGIPIGIITFIQRDYLEHPDIGFAFLPRYSKQGYAQEAARAVLNEIIKAETHSHILATTVKENSNSIRLLEKLGLQFRNELIVEGETLLVYAAASNNLILHELTQTFFNLFTTTNQQKARLELIHTICLQQAAILKKTAEVEETYTLQTFIESRKKILLEGTLTNFEESEISSDTAIEGNQAQRSSKYKKSGFLNGVYFETRGHKLFHFTKTTYGWKISAVEWEDEPST